MNLLLDTGFMLERIAEPVADDETVAKCPHLADTRVMAYYLHMRWRKRVRMTTDEIMAMTRGEQ
jgi:hypothetical protein